MKELQTREILEHRKQEATKAQQAHALDCPNFVKHVSDRVSKIVVCRLMCYSSPCVMTSGSLMKSYHN